MPIDLKKPELEVLVDRINQVNLTNLDYRLITVGVPTVNTGANNTRIIVSGKPNSGVNGSVPLTYNRKNIDTVIGNRNKTFTQDNAVTTRDLVAKINLEYEINLDAEDIVSAPLPVFPNNMPGQTLPFTLTIAPGSLLYIGNVILNLRSRDISLSDLITSVEIGDIT